LAEARLAALDAAIAGLVEVVGQGDRQGIRALRALRERAQWLRGWLT
jgi:hypothetical protein